MIWKLILGGLWRPVAALLALLGIYAKGRADAKARADLRDLKADNAAHERINDANLGIGASDGERIDRLRDFAAKHGDGSSKAERR